MSFYISIYICVSNCMLSLIYYAMALAAEKKNMVAKWLQIREVIRVTDLVVYHRTKNIRKDLEPTGFKNMDEL